MRVFVAIALPDDVRAALAGLSGGVPGARWVKAESLHLTLRFIGEADSALLGDIDHALDGMEAPAFELHVKGVGQFGARRRVNQLWAGVAPCEPLALLQRRVESALGAIGLEPEGRRFHPHVTLARLRGAPIERVAAFLSEHGLFSVEPFAVESVELFSSFLSQDGAIYRAESSYGLQQPNRFSVASTEPT